MVELGAWNSHTNNCIWSMFPCQTCCYFWNYCAYGLAAQKSSPAVELILSVANRLHSYIGECLSDFAWIGSSSEGWLSDLGIGRLVPIPVAKWEKQSNPYVKFVVSGVNRRGKAAYTAESSFWWCKTIVLVVHTPTWYLSDGSGESETSRSNTKETYVCRVGQ